MTPMSMANSVLAGDRLALSRLLTQIENNAPHGQSILDELFVHTGSAHLVGVTGAPGTGKSSLVNQLAFYYRNPAEGVATKKVAIIAVDPTSPFTGGAILGDRIRMRDLAGDEGVFIRSMATRGALGGLAVTTTRVSEVFDAAGYDLIFIETVGAGQVEVDIARLAHTTIVIDAPGLGDDVQAIKAGILEIADILVVNKSDRPGADQAVRALKQMLNLAHPTPKVFQDHSWLKEDPTGDMDDENVNAAHSDSWIPPLISTTATEGKGVAELAGAIDEHRAFLERTGEGTRRERERLVANLESMVQEAVMAQWRSGLGDGAIDQVIDQLARRSISPTEAVAQLMDEKSEI